MSGEQQEFDDLAEFKAYLDGPPRPNRKRAERPVVQDIGPGPEPKPGPFCQLCADTRRLVLDVLKLPDGRKVPLCRTCVTQVEWDRAHRCLSCGTYTETRLFNSGGVCPKCASKGAEAQQNLTDLIKLRRIMVIRGG